MPRIAFSTSFFYFSSIYILVYTATRLIAALHDPACLISCLFTVNRLANFKKKYVSTYNFALGAFASHPTINAFLYERRYYETVRFSMYRSR